MVRKICKILCFLLILGILMSRFECIFNFKDGDGIFSLTKFYEQEKNSIDVMCFGSSHVFENVNTAILWDEYGIADFNLCGSIQPLWNTYYYMKEALKTQTPRLIVVDVYGAVQTEEYMDHSRIIKNNYGLRWSLDKIESVKVSSSKDMWMDYLLEYPTYHSRYSEIGRTDFVKDRGNENMRYWKGFGINSETTVFEEPVLFDTGKTRELTDKVEEYLLKIIGLAKQNGVELLLVKTPYVITMEEQEKYNTVALIAEQNDIPLVNFNMYYEEIGIDFATDCADANHLNNKGNVKFTRYLADYIKKNYDIPDRRGDDNYQSYDLMADNYQQQVYNIELKEINDIGTYIDKAQNENYLVVYTMRGEYSSIENYNEVKNKLMSIGIKIDEVEGDAVWVVQNGEILFTSSSMEDGLWYIQLGQDNKLMVSVLGLPNQSIEVSFNNVIYQSVSSGLNMFVYDMCTESMVQSAGFMIQENKLVYNKIVK